MNALLIPADPTPQREITVAGLDDLQALVGGYIQTIPYPGRRDVVPYFNEDGKLHGLPPNARATQLLAWALFPDDVIAGDCVLTGTTPDGALADLPADLAGELIAQDGDG